MSGGYVQYNGNRSPLKNKPRGSGNEYIFTPGIFIRVEDKSDFAFYKWKASKSEIKPCGEKTWVAKQRTGKEDVTRETQKAGRKLVDRNDPNFDEAAKIKEVAEMRKELDEKTRKYFGLTLPEYLQEEKGLLKKAKPKKDGDE